jgi:outer membrane protein OmpA-like peptidoglycan-associated protein
MKNLSWNRPSPWFFAVLPAALLLISASASAQEAMETNIGVFGGYNWLSKTTELGDLGTTHLADTASNAGLIGARASFNFLSWLGLEGEFKYSFSHVRNTALNAASDPVIGMRAQLIASLPIDSPIRPFLTVGVGNEGLLKAVDFSKKDFDTDAVFGVGARWDFHRHFGARVDGRMLVVPGYNTTTAKSALTTDWEAHAGIYLRLGTSAGDADKDGIDDDNDKCPNEAEDKDGFQDADGCPDLDNDGDGIADDKDKCPNDPETKNGYQDDDGCPDVNDTDGDGIPDDKDKCPHEPETKNGYLDDDGCPDELDKDNDGIVDSQDKCPDQPETKNGFEDTDGCPDEWPDQDKDGIFDKDDKCPSEPETKNGFEDNDGCPDELPKKLAKSFNGTMKGIVFEKGSSKVHKKSFKILDKAVALLKEYPEVKVEVSGHTDNTGDAAENKKLSQERAEAVKAYLVEKGVEVARIAAVGYGDEKPIADNKKKPGQAKNRRIEFRLQ